MHESAHNGLTYIIGRRFGYVEVGPACRDKWRGKVSD
jgi:hypothetical protein